MKYLTFVFTAIIATPALAFAQGWLMELESPTMSFLRKPPSPRYEIVDNDEKFQLAVDVPGMNMNDMNVTLEDGGHILVVSGHREVKNEGYSFNSRFSQSFTLDPAVDSDKLAATLHDGVLVVTAPKDNSKVSERVRKILINQLEDNDKKSVVNDADPAALTRK